MGRILKRSETPKTGVFPTSVGPKEPLSVPGPSIEVVETIGGDESGDLEGRCEVVVCRVGRGLRHLFSGGTSYPDCVP